MSDAFSDLWNSTGVAKPAEPPRKLGSLASASPAPAAARRPQNDVFSMLAAAGSSSNVGSRSVTPAHTPALGSNGPAKPIQKAASTGTALGGSDAFSGLLSGFSSTQSANGANLTIAQRAALAEKERRERAQQQTSNPPQAAHAWAGLDALGGSSATANTQSSTTSHDPLDDLGFGAFTSSSTSTSPPIKVTQSAPQADDDWGFGEFSSQPAPAGKRKGPAASGFDDLLGFDDFSAPAASRQSSSPAPPRSDTLGDFDFGNREDGLLGGQSSDEDDILGDLSKPVEKLAAVSACGADGCSSRIDVCRRDSPPATRLLPDRRHLGSGLARCRHRPTSWVKSSRWGSRYNRHALRSRQRTPVWTCKPR